MSYVKIHVSLQRFENILFRRYCVFLRFSNATLEPYFNPCNSILALLVGSKPNPGKSCKDLLAHGGTVSGNYYIRLGGQTLLVYCDQTTAGGGWTLVYSYSFSKIKSGKKTVVTCMPKPTWEDSEVPVSTTPPKRYVKYIRFLPSWGTFHLVLFSS